MHPSPLLAELIAALQFLPGIGPKSAQRIAFHLLDQQRDKALRLADTLRARPRTSASARSAAPVRAKSARSAPAPAATPAHLRRENPLDVAAIEQAADFRGRYFVLMGRLSPIDGVTPARIGLPVLEQRLRAGDVRELIVPPARPWKVRRPRITCAKWHASAGSEPPASRTAYRSAANSNSSTVRPCRARSPAVTITERRGRLHEILGRQSRVDRPRDDRARTRARCHHRDRDHRHRCPPRRTARRPQPRDPPRRRRACRDG